MIPKDKLDEASIVLLEQASDEEVVEIAEQLLEWLQNVNWPVFNGIVNRLSILGSQLEVPILKVLEGSDSIWKANIVGHLIPAFSEESQQIYTKSLEVLLENYDKNDLEEGVIDFVEAQLSNASKYT